MATSRSGRDTKQNRVIQLYPLGDSPGSHTPYEDLGLGPKSDSNTPYVIINMVSSLDGRVEVDGKSGAIGSDVDRDTMRMLRSKVDAVMVGSGTLKAETVSLISEGIRDPEPLAVIHSSTLDMPFPDNIKDSSPDRTLIITSETSRDRKRSEEPGVYERFSENATILAFVDNGDGSPDLEEAMRHLRSEYGVETLLLEGGPGMNYRMISAGFVDEIFLTLSPKLLGGTPDNSLNILSGERLEDITTELVSSYKSLESEELFLRYRLI